MYCPHFDVGECRSCTLLEMPYPSQVARKVAACRTALAPWPSIEWEDPVTSSQHGFRNKAKLAVGGTAQAPTLGLVHQDGSSVDLRDCALYPAALQAAFGPLAQFIGRAGLTPYDLATRRGELKYLLVTISPTDQLMVRFVLRSTEAVSRIRKHLPTLQAALPQLAVASVNILPEHKAVLEGEREIMLTSQTVLPMAVGAVPLDLRPQSFFQTNTAVADALYRTAHRWTETLDITSVWDLYCGVGGFALNLARPGRQILGVEISAEAVASAQLTATRANIPDVRFIAADATAFAQQSQDAPDLVVVNPPRRGIGADLAHWLDARDSVRYVLYSSCNPASLGQDLEAMPHLAPQRARLLDMFPNTDHAECLVLLTRS